MKNLDDDASFPTIDTQNYLAEIDCLPDQLARAWELGLSQPLPHWDDVRQVVVAGMGGSAIGADLLASYLAPSCSVPFLVHRNYNLPAWAHGLQTLLVASSHSGNTEETLAAFEQAQERGCRTVAICTGGQLAQKAHQAGTPVWTFVHRGQPRAAVGFSFALLLALMTRLGLTPDPSQALDGTITTMRAQQTHWRAEMPLSNNPAKRLAGQLVGRNVIVLGADILEPVARRWKSQINELAKAWGQFEFLPEADHNTLAGLSQPEDLLIHTSAIFLRARSYYPRNLSRVDLTRQVFMLEGISTETIEAAGDTPLAQQWTTLLYGDYVAYYLAMLYGVDPTPVSSLTEFKNELASRE